MQSELCSVYSLKCVVSTVCSVQCFLCKITRTISSRVMSALDTDHSWSFCPCYTALHCVALTLYYTALHCTVLQYHYTALHCTALCCTRSILLCTALHCVALYCTELKKTKVGTCSWNYAVCQTLSNCT